MSAFAFVSTTCDPRRFPPGPSTPSVQLDTCPSSPTYVSIGVLLSGSGSSVTRKPQGALSHRRTPISFRAPQPSGAAVVDRERHAPMMSMREDKDVGQFATELIRAEENGRDVREVAVLLAGAVSDS